MKRERYSIIYSSKTGNTKKLAEAIYNTLPQNKCDYYGTVDKIDDVLSNVIYIGFWTEKGNADHLTIDFLNKLKNKKIFLFGTAGYGESKKYFEGIINNVKKNIDSSNTIIGTFMCQGKMPLSVRERYEKMREQNNISLNIDKLFTEIQIEDNGIGIRETELADIFKRFYRSKDVEKKEGSGIGLYLSRLILEKEKGYMTVKSVYGKGSCFSVFLQNCQN